MQYITLVQKVHFKSIQALLNHYTSISLFRKDSSYNPLNNPWWTFSPISFRNVLKPHFYLLDLFPNVFSILQKGCNTSHQATILLVVNEKRKHQMCETSSGVYVQSVECSCCCWTFSPSITEKECVVLKQLCELIRYFKDGDLVQLSIIPFNTDRKD